MPVCVCVYKSECNAVSGENERTITTRRSVELCCSRKRATNRHGTDCSEPRQRTRGQGERERESVNERESDFAYTAANSPLGSIVSAIVFSFLFCPACNLTSSFYTRFLHHPSVLITHTHTYTPVLYMLLDRCDSCAF